MVFVQVTQYEIIKKYNFIVCNYQKACENKETSEKYVKLTVMIPLSSQIKIKTYCALNSITMKEYITGLIDKDENIKKES